MEKICTTITQSKKLIELGIDVKTADMGYTRSTKGTYLLVTRGDHVDVPAWSLAALLDLITDEVQLTRTKEGKYYLLGDEYDCALDVLFEYVCWQL